MAKTTKTTKKVPMKQALKTAAAKAAVQDKAEKAAAKKKPASPNPEEQCSTEELAAHGKVLGKGSKVVVVKAKAELSKKQAHEAGLKAAEKVPAGADPEVKHAAYESARDAKLAKKPATKPEAKPAAEPKSRIRGEQTDAVKVWISKWLTKNPDGRCAAALAAFREAGKSCAQTRFGAAFLAVLHERAKAA
jgi:L-lactate utilization protein LutC